ncbi:MAG: ATPase domain-containing protein [Candidatus Thermoplasmatota archaeon]|nr:ATPase domain-containing protein [Candidatus Thermoplasmatota archaeon]
MTLDEFISTGMESLDKLLEGGILKGFTTLILGSPGSSMEILGKQLATTDSVLYIATEETKDEVAETMDRFGWDSSKIDFVDMASKYSQDILSGERKRVSIYERRSKQKLKELIKEGSSGIPVQAKDKEDFLAIVSNEIRSTSSEKIIINSLDFFLGRYSQEEVLKTLHAAKVDNVEKKGALFIIMTKGIYGDVFEKKMERIADCVIELEVLQKGSTFERFLAVTKVRNYAKKIGMARYVIDSDGFVLETIERII